MALFLKHFLGYYLMVERSGKELGKDVCTNVAAIFLGRNGAECTPVKLLCYFANYPEFKDTFREFDPEDIIIQYSKKFKPNPARAAELRRESKQLGYGGSHESLIQSHDMAARETRAIDQDYSPVVELGGDGQVVDVEATHVKTLEETERDTIIESLNRNGGRRKATAQELQISERTLYRKIKLYNLDR